ncbi:MAG: tetratricopeptide repeat protein [Elusimicrobia bacterium]|nr:tetratricopeptide repeat protein [Elusimicrobiota bacterium]
MLALLFLIPAALQAEPYRLPRDLDTPALKGLEAMYRLEFEQAEEAFRKMDSLQSAHPSGPLFLAGLYWWRRSQNFDILERDRSLEDAFWSAAREAVERAKQPDKWGGSSAERHFYEGMAYGLMGRWHMVHYRWMRAYYWGSKGRRRLKKAVKGDPEIYDAYLGLGIFDYYAGTLPSILKIPALLFVRGDKEKGLREAETTLQKGRYNPVEARLFLINVHNENERKPQEAMKLVDALMESDRGNLFFRLFKIITLSYLKNWEGLLKEGADFLKIAGMQPQGAIRDQLPLVHLYMGNSAIALRQPERAVQILTEGIEKAADPRKGWVGYCLLRRGQAYDILGEREKALEDYGRVLQRKPFWYEDRDAKKGLKKPYAHDEVLRLIEASATQ